jgi:hypothetical protein
MHGGTMLPANLPDMQSARTITTTEDTQRDWTQFPCLHGLGSESGPSRRVDRFADGIQDSRKKPLGSQNLDGDWEW